MNQNMQILEAMKHGAKITPFSALKLFGCFRLAARIYDLRQAGHEIDRQLVTEDDKTFARYTLVNLAGE